VAPTHSRRTRSSTNAAGSTTAPPAEISTHCATANLHFISTRAVIRGGGGGECIQQQANHEPIRSIAARDLHYQFKSAISAPPPTIKAPLLISLPFPRHTRDWH